MRIAFMAGLLLLIALATAGCQALAPRNTSPADAPLVVSDGLDKLNAVAANLDAWLAAHGVTPEGAAAAGDTAKTVSAPLPSPLNTIGWVLGTILTTCAGWWAMWRKKASEALAAAAALQSVVDGIEAAKTKLPADSTSTLLGLLHEAQLLQGTYDTVKAARPATSDAAAVAEA